MLHFLFQFNVIEHGQKIVPTNHVETKITWNFHPEIGAPSMKEEGLVSFCITLQLCLPSHSCSGVERSPIRTESLVPARVVQREMSFHCSAWHEAEVWRRDVTARNRVLPMLQVSVLVSKSVPRCNCAYAPVPVSKSLLALVMQRDASLSHPTRHDAAGWRRDSTVVGRLLHLNQFS